MSDTRAFATVVDTETTCKSVHGCDPLHPMSPDNKIVLIGTGIIHPIDNTDIAVQINTGEEFAKAPLNQNPFHHLFIMQNCAFDFKHIWKTNQKVYDWLGEYVSVWDTQVAEYILSGQLSRYPSLAEMQRTYLGAVIKDDTVSKMFDEGKGADEIPSELLLPYLRTDVTSTGQIALKQMEKATQLNMLPLIVAMNEARLATADAEFVGMKVDADYLRREAEAMHVSLKNAKASLAISAISDCGKPLVFDVTSNDQLRTYLFGGDVSTIHVEAVGLTKTGKVKTKKVEKIVHHTGVVKETLDVTMTAGGKISVDEESLRAYQTHLNPTSWPSIVIDKVLAYREMSKEYSTYYVGLLERLFPNGFVYGSIHHTSTATGRTSSSNPNLQNMSNSSVKKAFVSRWGDAGRIVELDFNQLEVVILAHLTQDPTLINDIKSGVDIHSELYKDMYGRYPTKEERKPFKRLTFGLIYGSAAAGLAALGKVTIAEAKKFITTFYKRYPMVQAWQNRIFDYLNSASCIKKFYHDADGKLTTYSLLKMETGRILSFRHWPDKYSGLHKVSRTEAVNYPVQSLATGDIVLLMVGKVWRAVKKIFKGDAVFVNVVHDSLVFDVKLSVLDDFCKLVAGMLRDTPKFYQETFGIAFTFDELRVGCSTGPNWLDMVERAI